LLDKLAKDAPVLTQMVELSAQYPRYGYRRIAIFLGRDGHAMSFGRAYRLWRCARLQVPRKRPRKRIATGRPRPNAPSGANQVWSYDFVFDWCANGQQLKCLTVTDEWTKEGLAIEVDGRIRSGRVIEVLSRLVSERGTPLYLRSDNGPEFVSRALLKWIVSQGIATALIDPGKPWQNGATESFNGKFRDDEAKDGAPAFQPGLSHACRVRSRRRGEKRGERRCDGAARCGMWGLRAPPRRITVPQGANDDCNRGSCLKLKVVRRNRAGQGDHAPGHRFVGGFASQRKL
jgi:putative transposase